MKNKSGVGVHIALMTLLVAALTAGSVGVAVALGDMEKKKTEKAAADTIASPRNVCDSMAVNKIYAAEFARGR